jgi:hypothetical protein
MDEDTAAVYTLYFFYIFGFPLITYYVVYTFLYLSAYYDDLWDKAVQEIWEEDETPRRTARDFTACLDTARAEGTLNENYVCARTHDEELAHERTWKTRVLMKMTERYGNIIMYYDFFRGGFAYYCDLHSVNYDVLTQLAREYVVHFRCVGYWEADVSSFIMIEDKKEHTDERTQYRRANISTLQQRLTAPPPPEIVLTELNAAPAAPKNKFIRVGRISDYSILQKPKTTLEKRAVGDEKKISYVEWRRKHAEHLVETPRGQIDINVMPRG